LINKAKLQKADLFVTADIKYHEFFDADDQMLMADIGHFESEQFTVELLVRVLRQKYPNFAVLNSEVATNPVHYFMD
jgi:putative NIF3 family GTP cyclohydrolase 1 type 2